MFNFLDFTMQANLMSPVVSEETHFLAYVTQAHHEADDLHDKGQANRLQGQVLSNGAGLNSGAQNSEAWALPGRTGKPGYFQLPCLGLSYLA